MPPAVENCVESILEDNPDYTEERAYQVCNAMQERGELDDGTDAASLLGDGTCPEGMVDIDGACVDIESVDAPANILSKAARQLAGPIERVEQSDGSVRYKEIQILSEGVWTDNESKQPTHYDPKNLEVEPDNAVNIMHDDGNDVSEVGEIDAESAYVEDGDLYADIVFHMDNAASEYADENMQTTLETGGDKGFGGPSVEIPPEGLEIEEHGELGYPKTEAGVINGLGLVKNPASRPTAFDTQTATRAVALSSGQTDKALLLQRADMANPFKLLADHSDDLAKALQDMAQVMDAVESAEAEGFDSSEQTVSDLINFVNNEMDVGEESVQAMQDAADAFLETVDADALDAVSAEAMRDWIAESQLEEDEEEEEEEAGKEAQDDGAVAAIEEQIEDLWGEVETLKDEMLDGEDMSEELEALAAAETVNELQEAADELDKRLSDIEDEEKEARTMAEGGGEDAEGFDWSDPNDHSARYDATTGTTY